MSFAERVGQVRPSQLLYMYGVGAAIDLPHLSALVLGIDDWDTANAQEISEERLLAAVRVDLGRQVSTLRLPPRMEETRNPFDDWARTGVPVATFPQWLRCPSCSYLGPISSGLFELRTDPYRPDRACYTHTNCNRARRPTALPVRFLLACPAGHLDEFPWVHYAHQGQPCGAPILELFERGVTGRAAEIIVKCRSCGAPARSLADAFGSDTAGVLPKCRGRHPHLRSFDGSCDQRVKTILLGASNAWFPVTRSALSIPRSKVPLAQKVADHWQKLKDIKTRDILEFAMSNMSGLSVFLGFDVDDLWAAVGAYRQEQAGDGTDEEPDLLAAEWEVFASPEDAPPTDNFHLRVVPVPRGLEGLVEQVVLAERLREVVALLGFTRVDPPGETDVGDLVPQAPLSRGKPLWVPCSEVRGEGIFLRFPETTMASWEARVAEHPVIVRMMEAHRRWRLARSLDPDTGWPGARYALLHTLAHALITQFSLECGYGAASIRERLYARGGAEPMAGVLLYTAAPDSEGTLGGLVSLGEPENLGRLMAQALDRARLCASDPMCAEHDPVSDRSLHGAACHACQFVPETSCERGNRYLDRTLLVTTFRNEDIGYFADV